MVGSYQKKKAFLPCGHLDFESSVTTQNDEFMAVFVARLHIRLTAASVQSIRRTRKRELALEMTFHLDFHRVTWPWQRTPTTGSDVKNMFARCRELTGSVGRVLVVLVQQLDGVGHGAGDPRATEVHPGPETRPTLGNLGRHLIWNAQAYREHQCGPDWWFTSPHEWCLGIKKYITRFRVI